MRNRYHKCQVFSDAENINAHAFKINKRNTKLNWHLRYNRPVIRDGCKDSSHRKMYALLSFDWDDREQYDKNKRMSMRQ